MVVLNKTRKTTLTKNLKEAKSFMDSFFGLLRQSNPRSLLFKTRFGIHTFCLKVPIDVIVLDSKFRVVKLQESLKPNRLFFWNPKYNLVIELSEGTINKSKTQIKDSLKCSSSGRKKIW